MLTMGVVGKYAPSQRISHLSMFAYIGFNCIFVFPSYFSISWNDYTRRCKRIMIIYQQKRVVSYLASLSLSLSHFLTFFSLHLSHTRAQLSRAVHFHYIQRSLLLNLKVENQKFKITIMFISLMNIELLILNFLFFFLTLFHSHSL